MHNLHFKNKTAIESLKSLQVIEPNRLDRVIEKEIDDQINMMSFEGENGLLRGLYECFLPARVWPARVRPMGGRRIDQRIGLDAFGE